MDKLIFLPRLQRERDQFEALLNQTGFARQMTIKGTLERYSIKDLLSDVMARGQFFADRLAEIQADETYSPCMSHSALASFEKTFGYPDYESPLIQKNISQPSVMEHYLNVELDEIVAQDLAVYADILNGLVNMPHRLCLDYDLYHRAAEHTYRPYRRVMAQIHAWRASISSESK